MVKKRRSANGNRGVLDVRVGCACGIYFVFVVLLYFVVDTLPGVILVRREVKGRGTCDTSRVCVLFGRFW